MSHKFLVVARQEKGIVEISDDAKRAATQVGSEKREATGPTIGGKVWEAMRAAGVSPQGVNHLAIFEADENGTLIATVHPVLEGAHATWLVLYRADREGSVFRALGSRNRLGDALDAAFTKLIEEIVMPHKP